MPRSPVALIAIAVAVLGGCAQRPSDFDYTAFTAAKPVSLLVMPPLNDSPDVKATPAVWAQAARPLAEAGYYVLPVGLVDGMLRQNGVNSAHDAAEIPYPKLREVFGADAAVYIRIHRYGAEYAVVDSRARVEVTARIVDLRNGALLWKGEAVATSSNSVGGGNLIGILVAAVVNQVVNSVADRSFDVAGDADRYLLGHGYRNGVLPGPRRPLPPEKPAP
jgi:hypothetical protein